MLVRRWLWVSSALLLLGCLERINPVVTARVDGDPSGSGDGALLGDAAGDVDQVLALTVVPIYPLNADWNDYVRHDEPTRDALHQTDTACLGNEAGGPANCVHGGDKRKAILPGVTSCAGVAASDALGAFTWVCDDGGGVVEVLAAGLAPFKGLRDLLDASGFLPNRLRVTRAGQVIGESALTVWGWTNPILPLPPNPTGAAVSLDQEAAIYVTTGIRETAGYNLNADRVALVTLGDGELAYSGASANNCNATTGETDSPNRSCLTAAGNQRFVWLELVAANQNPPASHLIYLVDVHFSRVQGTRLRADRYGDGAVHLRGNSSGTLLSDLSIDRSNADAILLADSGDNVVRRATITAPWSTGVQLDNATRNRLEEITVVQAGSTAVHLSLSHHNRLIGLRLFDSGAYGLLFDEASFNVVHQLVVANTRALEAWEGNAIRVYGYSRHNVLTRILAASNTRNGFFAGGNADTQTVSHLTVANSGEGFSIGNVAEITAAQVLTANTQGGGLGSYGPDDNRDSTFADFFLAHSSNTAVSLQSGVRQRYTGHLWLGQNSGLCWVDVAGTQPGLITNTCSDTGLEGSNTYAGQLSDAVLHVDRDLSGAFTGRLVDDEPANISDANGQRAYDAIDDWTRFSNAWRTWGRSGSAFPNSDHRGPCISGETCAIWDWRLNAADAAIRNVHGSFTPGAPCPASAHGDQALTDRLLIPFYDGINGVEAIGDGVGDEDGVCEVGDLCANRFLIRALELVDDGVGDEDGLCESDEVCVYSPNVGAYQGEGELGAPCQFVDGAVTRVILHGYLQNGD